MRNYFKTQVIVCALVILVLVIMTGCFPATQNNKNLNSHLLDHGLLGVNNENDASEFPTNIEDKDIEKLTIKANVNFPDNLDVNRKVSTSTAKLVTWDRDSFVAEFSNGRQVVDEFSSDNMGPGDTFYSYGYEDGSSLVFYFGAVSYRTVMSDEHQYSYYFNYFENFKDENALKNMFSDKNIDGVEKSVALDSANQVASLLEIDDILGHPQIYTMDADSVNQLQDEMDARDKYGNAASKWTSEQEAYLLVYPVLYQNIPSLYLSTANNTNEMMSSPKVWFIYGRNGLISFDISRIFDVESTIQEAPVCSPLDVVKIVKSSFENIIMDRELTISSIKLGYIARQDMSDITEGNFDELKIEPVWFVDGKYEIATTTNSSNKKGSASNPNYFTIISAVSGETIPVNSIGG